ncbi:MAG: hypothetical protein H0X51_06410 [Parachlamydiaceae bacterium]|nr:hypothetical protein [Parachlamydiaceae bacterium]
MSGPLLESKRSDPIRSQVSAEFRAHDQSTAASYAPSDVTIKQATNHSPWILASGTAYFVWSAIMPPLATIGVIGFLTNVTIAKLEISNPQLANKIITIFEKFRKDYSELVYLLGVAGLVASCFYLPIGIAMSLPVGVFFGLRTHQDIKQSRD